MTNFAQRLIAVAATALVAGCVSPRAPDFVPSTNVVVLGSARVDADTRTVIATGYVNMASGAIELLACGPNGKRHESIFVIETGAVDLQAALLLAGAEGGVPMTGPGAGPPKGSTVDVYVEWFAGGHGRVERADYFIRDNNSQAPLARTSWTFTGSVMEDGGFKALAEESVIATYWDPWAIINITSPVGSDDERLSANETRIPPIETPVTFYIRLR